MITSSSHIRGGALQGAALASKTESVRKLLAYGLMRDHENRKMVALDYDEVALRLKARPKEEDQ